MPRGPPAGSRWSNELYPPEFPHEFHLRWPIFFSRFISVSSFTSLYQFASYFLLIFPLFILRFTFFLSYVFVSVVLLSFLLPLVKWLIYLVFKNISNLIFISALIHKSCERIEADHEHLVQRRLNSHTVYRRDRCRLTTISAEKMFPSDADSTSAS